MFPCYCTIVLASSKNRPLNKRTTLTGNPRRSLQFMVLWLRLFHKCHCNMHTQQCVVRILLSLKTTQSSSITGPHIHTCPRLRSVRSEAVSSICTEAVFPRARAVCGCTSHVKVSTDGSMWAPHDIPGLHKELIDFKPSCMTAPWRTHGQIYCPRHDFCICKTSLWLTQTTHNTQDWNIQYVFPL